MSYQQSRRALPQRRFIVSAITAALAALASTGYAEGDAVQLKKVQVHGDVTESYNPVKLASPKRTEPLRDTPQTITVVPKQVIEQRGASSLADVLRNVSGISLTAGEGGGARGDNFRIRGFASNTDMFVDGMREIAQFSNRDPFNMESVEVVKGPSSSHAGRGATGGSINQVSKQPTLESFISGTAGLGSDDYYRTTLDYNQPLDDSMALRLNLMGHKADVPGRDVTDNKRWGVAPTLAWGLGSDTRATLGYYHLRQDNITDYGLPSAQGRLYNETGNWRGIDKENWYGFRHLNTEDSEARVGTFRAEHDVNQRISLRNQLRYGENEQFMIVTPPRGPDVAADSVRHNPNLRDSLNRVVANQTDLTTRFNTGGIEHSLVLGVEISRETYNTQAWSFEPEPPTDSLFNPNRHLPYFPTRTAGDRVRNEAETLAAYVFDTIKLNQQWQLNGGLRWDHYEAESKTTENTGAVSKVDRTDVMTSWNAGVVYKPTSNGSVYLAYGTSFNPSAEAGTISTDSRAGRASDLVEPEENESWELGTKWDLFSERLSLTGALFRIEKTNARTPGLPGEPTTVLDGEQRIDGFELGATGSITDKWAVIAGYTYLDGEVTRSNNPEEHSNEIGNVPHNTVSLWTTYRLLPQLEVGIGAQFIDDRTVSSTVPNDLDSYTLFDAMVAYDVSRNFAVQLNIYNLTDEFYFEKLHGGGNHAVPGAARSAVLNATYRL